MTRIHVHDAKVAAQEEIVQDLVIDCNVIGIQIYKSVKLRHVPEVQLVQSKGEAFGHVAEWIVDVFNLKECE